MRDLRAAREAMVRTQIERRGIRDARVLEAMRRVPREAFVSPGDRPRAYADCALPIAEGQTISQPYVVAQMVEALDIGPADHVLEVGTGSGYAAAVLAELAASVVTIERLPRLASEARERLSRLAYDGVQVVVGDGTLGWSDEAPYDAILVSAHAPVVPPALEEQLAGGGRLVLPVGRGLDDQRLVRRVRGVDGGIEETSLGGVRFVRLIGHDGWPAD